MLNPPSDLALDFQRLRERITRKASSAWFREKRREIESLAPYDPGRGRERLDQLLATAAQQVPHYRALRDRDREQLGLGDFPLTRKSDLREHFADFISRDGTGRMAPGAFFLTQTGGSTGQPVTLLSTAETGGLSNRVIRERFSAFLGLPDSGTVLNVGLLFPGTPLVEAVMLPRPYVKWNLRGYDPGTPGIVADYEAVVGRFPVDEITGSSSRVVALARYCLDRGITLRPHGVVATYEHMPDGGRRIVEEAFGRPVTMLYATSETGYAAFECEQRRMHFQDDLVLPEIEPVGDGRAGEVVLTPLLSTPMPVIRYVTGDLAPRPTACGCGLPGTVTDGLLGRARTSLVGLDGTVYSPYALLAALAAAGLPDFQVVQYEPGTLDLVTVGPAEAAAACVRDINTRLDAYFGTRQGFRLRHRPHDDFLFTANGKRNPVVQRLPLPDTPERSAYL
ncbi:hypothetical protein OOK31_15865 [Streptomyces sp. NBC_00249]|uniref:phenylacetate--CoA ligase family protein n=1 Tax=Streptomyces sp. NBC_00249 TaxID=2975690 RepID=UPI002257FDB7|nr:hypothetical protein [Streptomyces sp. NBC_00249]MCX5195360.1 hypothetical protein [Streptomyces sp. NBC_00249]